MNEKSKRITKEIFEYLCIIVVVLLFRAFLFSPIRVTGDSMVPTLNDGNIMILNKIGYKINGLKRFDIVVIEYQGEKLIKRVIGMPGEHVEYKNDELYIDGNLIEEGYERDDTDDFILQEIKCSKNKLECSVIPKDMYLVLGDNRSISKDSRSIGLVSSSDIEGYAKTVIFPLNKIGKVK